MLQLRTAVLKARWTQASCSVLQCIFGVFPCVALCGSECAALHRDVKAVAGVCCMLQSVAGDVLQCVAVCCSVLRCVAEYVL